MAEDKKAEAADDKSINELLKEYADDVKDKDLDDFLKSGDDDAFESDEAGDDESDAGDAVAAEEPKKSGGLLTGLLMLVAFAAAGAGTYVYLNKGEGMTAIMGGFAGGDTASQIDTTLQPVTAPETQPAAPALGELPAQPSPIVNEAAAPELPMPTDAPAMPAPTTGMEPPAADLLAAEAPKMPEAPKAPEASVDVSASEITPATPPVAEAVPAPTPAASDAAKAVDAWASGEPDVMQPASDLPVANIEEVKAQPVKTPKQEKAESAPAPKKAAAVSSDDGALPPPFIAIQGGKGKSAEPTKAKMAPVVEGRATASASERNINEADKTSATGDYRNMVMNGGGKIEISGSRTTFVPAGGAVANDVVPVTSPSAAAENAPRRLAISGGKSLPDGYVAAPVQSATPVPAPEIDAPAVEALAAMKPMMKAAPMPKAEEPAAMSAPAGATDAKAVLSQAMALEKAGKSGDALELYQRALELDAVYGNGKSIDRGMVYDRIGAIRAAQ